MKKTTSHRTHTAHNVALRILERVKLPGDRPRSPIGLWQRCRQHRACRTPNAERRARRITGGTAGPAQRSPGPRGPRSSHSRSRRAHATSSGAPRTPRRAELDETGPFAVGGRGFIFNETCETGFLRLGLVLCVCIMSAADDSVQLSNYACEVVILTK